MPYSAAFICSKLDVQSFLELEEDNNGFSQFSDAVEKVLLYELD